MNCMQFSSVFRADEMIRLNIDSLWFIGSTIDSPVVATLEIAKNNANTRTHFTFTRGLHISICGLAALLRWLCVLKAFGITSVPLFLTVVSNRLQAWRRIDHDTHRNNLQKWQDELEFQGTSRNAVLVEEVLDTITSFYVGILWLSIVASNGTAFVKIFSTSGLKTLKILTHYLGTQQWVLQNSDKEHSNLHCKLRCFRAPHPRIFSSNEVCN